MTRRMLLIVGGTAIGAAILAAVVFFVSPRHNGPTTQPALKKVVINEAVRTLLYLPLYYAVDQGYFRDAGLDVQIVTGGTATNSFAAMLSGEADFSQADPMYVPISREKGSQTKVVAQVVARIAVWAVAKDPAIKEWTAETVRGKKISTQVRPMTAYTYAVKAVKELGLDPDKDVEILQNQPGTEIVPLFNGHADFAFTLEPNVSKVVAQGAHVVLSLPERLGDIVFTGLMAREDYIRGHRDTVVKVVKAYQRALDEIRKAPDHAVVSAMKYFPQLDKAVINVALRRLVNEHVIPDSVLITEDSWKRANTVRVESGDLRAAVHLTAGCDVTLMSEAASSTGKP